MLYFKQNFIAFNKNYYLDHEIVIKFSLINLNKMFKQIHLLFLKENYITFKM